MTVWVCETVESVRVLYPPVALSEDRLWSNKSSELSSAACHSKQLRGVLLVVVTDEMTLDATIEAGKVEFPKAMIRNNQHEFLEFLALWFYLTIQNIRHITHILSTPHV